MPANVKSMMYKGETLWHRIGKDCNDVDVITSADAIRYAGADYDVEVVPCFTLDAVNGEPKIQIVPGYNVIRNASNRTIYGSCGDVWKPLQNRDAFKWFDPFLDSGMVHIHTAGVLGEGEAVWILAKVNSQADEVRKGDFIERFILLSNAHDGKTGIRVGYTPIRVVCANTLAMAHSDSGSALLRLRHSKQTNFNLSTVRDTMNVYNQTFEATLEQYKILCSRDFSRKDVKDYVVKLWNFDLDVDGDKIYDRVKDVERIYAAGKGSSLAKGTWFDLYNTVNEYLNYSIGTRTSQDSRLNSLWFGANQRLNTKALTTALEMSVA